MMKKIAIRLLIGITLSISQQTVANLIYPGKLSSFDDASLDGWSKGPRSNVQPQIKMDEQGRHYLEVMSVGELAFEGERDPDSRLKVSNRTSWLPDYDLLGIIAIQVRMANLGKKNLHMRFFLAILSKKKCA